MKYILLVLISCLPLSLFAQTPDSVAVARKLDTLLAKSNELRDAGKYEEALPFAQQIVDISKQKWGENSAKYATSLQLLAQFYHRLRQYANAEELYLKVIKIRANVLGKEHSRYISSLNTLAYLYWETGKYSRAIPLYLEAKKTREKTLGKGHPDYAESLDNLASTYLYNDEYEKAEPLYAELIAIREKTVGKEHVAYATPLNTLGVLYMKKGDYAKAEPRLLEATKIKAKVLGERHPSYATSLDNLASLYKDKGDYDKAETLFLKAKQIRADALGEEHPDYAASLNNLAILYMDKGEYDKAEPLMLEGIKIKEEAVGKEHLEYARYLNNLADLYKDKDDYAKAEPMYLEALKIRAKTLEHEHPDYAVSLSNLASLYLKKGDYEKAGPPLLEAIEIQAKVLGKEHPDYAASLNNLAVLYQEINQIFKSTGVFLELNRLYRHFIEQSATYSSESQMLAYLHTFDDDLAQFQSFAQTYPSPKFNSASFDNALFYSGYLLENARHLARAVAKADSLTRDTFERLQGCRRRLANEYIKPIAERRYVAEVEAEAEGYEKTLTRKLPTFGKIRQVPHWQDVRDHLRTSEAAVEFIHYRYYNPKATDSTMYAALVLLSGDTCPHFVPLCEQQPLDNLLRKKYPDIRYQLTSSGNSLYNLLWRPIELLLKGAGTVYYAPSGVLHSVNLDAIMLNLRGDSTLIDKYNLVRLGSTGQLVAPIKAKIAGNDALLFGGIRYESDSTAIQIQNNNNGVAMRGDSEEGLLEPADSLQQIRALDPLPSTRKEVEFIQKLLTRKKFNARMFTDFGASEEAFKHFSDSMPASGASARVLHLATHGYFFPDLKSGKPSDKSGLADKPVFRISEHPFLRSGLVLAGGDHAWQTGKPFKNGMEDGILTAYEISAMSLPNTELVVLSACETGLGDVSGNEGVYGLQRAFKIAGAQYLIMSLWKVPDEATKELMTAFYRNWLDKKMDIPAAFRAAQMEIKNKFKDPEMWAGFVLVQ